ncbi:MAG: S8 family serine peptidase, partial [FCB group bacterium]
MKFFKINILFIILIVLFGINNLFAKNEKVSSYIIKFKNPTETTISYLKQSVSIKQIFNGIQNIKVNSNSLLSAKQKNDFNELNKYFLLNLPSNSNQDSIVAELKNNPDVALLEPNYVYRIDQPSTKPNDPLYPTQWALQNIFAERAWQKATGKNVIVGVIDTGIDFDHEDLKNQLWINSGEDINHNGKFDPWPSTEIRNGVSGDLNGMDDDGNGYIDDVIGYDFVDQTITNIGDYSNPDPIPTDEHGHGTNVSGVIAAQRDNSKGIVGLAYNSRIMTLRAFDATGDGESDDIARAIVYAALNGARVLNFSFGEVWASTIVHDAVKFAYSLNCVMPASSGNDNWYYPHYPSDYPECISVGASTVKNERASFSNYGSDLSLVAPGQDIEVTSPGNNYRTNNGTSFSAPYVSAASALLLELDSTLTPKDINGILQASSTGGNGWDIYMGAGILNAGEAVNTIGKTNISIISPSNNQVFNRTNITQLNIIGKVITPLFQSYQLFLGKGINPTEWDSLSSEQFEQIISDTIAKINISVLQDTSYTIRLLVKLKNNNTIENRVNIEIVSGNQPLKFSNLQQFSVFFNDRRATLVTAVTNLNSQLSVKFRRKYSSDQYVELSETDRYSNEHSILIQYEAMPDIPMEAIATAKTSEGLTFSADFEFTRSSEAFPENNFIIKNYTLPMAYLLNNVSDLYKNGKQTVELNDLTNGKWGPIKVYQFDNGNFVLKDSLTESWLPMDTGDSNGDGIPELLASKFGNTILFQSKTAGGSPFSSILFSDTVSNNLTAAKLYDLDNDNKPELIAFSDTSFIAFKYLNGKYSFIGEAKPPIQNMTIGTYPGYALGDFDGDGKPELCFSNNFGNIFIFEYSNNKFNLEYLDTTIVSNSEQYICTADVDGDGKPEILIANFGSIIPYGNDGAGEPLWNIKVLKSTGINQYKVMWQDYIYGVRGGTFYQNGVSAGNVDNQPGDEIIIAAFPNTYILKWNNSKSQMEPLWFYPYTYSNSAIVHDFDKNGINEVGISTFSGTNFYEYNGSPNKPDIPVAFDGWALNDSSAYL